MKTLPRVSLFLLAVTVADASLCLAAVERTQRYALVVGNNAPPVGDAHLGPLRYADDDAVRFYQMTRRWGAHATLLAVLDADSQSRYPKIPSVARPPTSANLKAAISAIAESAAAARARGDNVLFYFIFAGHGAIDQGTAYLALLDGRITQSVLYDQIVAAVPASFTHLLIDACHAGGIVGSRGSLDTASTAAAVTLSPQEMVGGGRLDRLPHVGALLSSTVGQQAHEWSEIESGVFSHELLSGLSGPADINRDGRIEYSEIEAFAAAAHGAIKQRSARPQLIARPPAHDRHAPLVDLPSQRGHAWLEGNPSGLGHFYLELENGERYLDAHLASSGPIRIAVPAATSVFLRSKNHEARFTAPAGQVVALDRLVMRPPAAATRGALSATFRRNLFATRFSAAYYRGYVNRVGGQGVAFDVAPPRYTVNRPFDRKPLAIGLLTLSGASLVAAAVLAGFAVAEHDDFESIELQQQAEPHRKRFERYRAIAIGTGAAAVATGIAGWLLLPSEPALRLNASIAPGLDQFALHAAFLF